jgi:hypothetical protein
MPTNIKKMEALSPERIIRIKAEAKVKKNKIRKFLFKSPLL